MKIGSGCSGNFAVCDVLFQIPRVALAGWFRPEAMLVAVFCSRIGINGVRQYPIASPPFVSGPDAFDLLRLVCELFLYLEG